MGADTCFGDLPDLVDPYDQRVPDMRQVHSHLFPPTELEAVDHGVGVRLAFVAELQPVGSVPLSRASPQSG